MIELAPYHKIGLPVENPILLAAGTIGYGEIQPAGLEPSRLGAVVVGPVMRHSAAGNPPPRYAAVAGGMVMASGQQNRGITTVLKRFAPRWPSLGCPVIAQIADTQPDLVAAVARRLHDTPGVNGLELLLPEPVDVEHAAALVRVAVRAGDLPVAAKLPLARAEALAGGVAAAGAATVVVGRPLRGASFRPDLAVAAPIQGAVYGPLYFAVMLDALLRVVRMGLPCGLVACGGIHSVEKVQQALDAGAHAVQIDSAVWVEPSLPVYLAAAFGR